MNFLDKVNIKVKAGKGGDGVVAFIREKYRPKGGPGGGDGGNGGSIVFQADESLSTLFHLRYKKVILAEDGQPGKNNNMHGRNGRDQVVKIPCGTIVREQKKIIFDFKHHNQSLVIAKGGKGGKGNARFASSRNPNPKICQNGAMGEIKNLELELFLLANVGLVGFPSVGKSTLLSVISNSKPKVGNYPFTTKNPHLGVVSLDDNSFVVADLPGLIKGASQNKGLGIKFLKHIFRCEVLVHILDMSSFNNRDVVSDYETINHELTTFSSKLQNKKNVVVANKMDDYQSLKNLSYFKKKYPNLEVIEISTFTKKGLKKLLYKLNNLVKKTSSQKVEVNQAKSYGYYKY